ncbi:unnamed protein product [Hyaloperonospora brassicae]|uniref:Uncharacterized protein n=1 Tax=Hyaloperonospora brassicae TaxID=162125 RepID=A0AAV0TIF5_HYABA|nr:unnamed protein product [Hyaloperonospora brassicae]
MPAGNRNPNQVHVEVLAMPEEPNADIEVQGQNKASVLSDPFILGSADLRNAGDFFRHGNQKLCLAKGNFSAEESRHQIDLLRIQDVDSIFGCGQSWVFNGNGIEIFEDF